MVVVTAFFSASEILGKGNEGKDIFCSGGGNNAFLFMTGGSVSEDGGVGFLTAPTLPPPNLAASYVL